jgi:signal transduction histidine kinase
MMRSGYLPLALELHDAVAGQNTYNSQLNHITDDANPADKRVWFDSALAVGRPQMFSRVRFAVSHAFAQAPSFEREFLAETARVEAFLSEDRELLRRLFSELRSGDTLSAEQTRDTLVTRGTEAANQLRALEQRVSGQVEVLTTAAAGRERWTLRALLLWIGFTIAFGVGVALYARRLLRPLLAVTERARRVAEGDLSPRPVVAGNDEIGELAHTFETMVGAIARANQALLDTERLATIGKMAAQVTHEVRNPLSSIALNLDLIEEELETQNSEVRALFVAIKREVERLTELTEQYLSVARRNDPELELEELGEVTCEALDFLAPYLQHHNVQLVREIAAGLPRIWIDATQLKQVLQNLVRNAREAMPEGGTLTIGVARISKNNKPHLALTVADTGPGIEPEIASRLFEPFATTKRHGTGLGLAVSRHIVETHGGELVCKPNQPRGTVFALILPLPTPEQPPTRGLASEEFSWKNY